MKKIIQLCCTLLFLICTPVTQIHAANSDIYVQEMAINENGSRTSLLYYDFEGVHLRVYDTSKPTSIKLIDTATFSLPDFYFFTPRQIIFQGSRIYLAFILENRVELIVYELTDHLKEVGHLISNDYSPNTHQLISPLAVDGDTVYLVDKYSSEGSSVGAYQFDVNGQLNNKRIASFAFNYKFVCNITVSEHRLYTKSRDLIDLFSSKYLNIFDVSDVTDWKQIASVVPNTEVRTHFSPLISYNQTLGFDYSYLYSESRIKNIFHIEVYNGAYDAAHLVALPIEINKSGVEYFLYKMQIYATKHDDYVIAYMTERSEWPRIKSVNFAIWNPANPNILTFSDANIHDINHAAVTTDATEQKLIVLNSQNELEVYRAINRDQQQLILLGKIGL